MHLLYKIDSYLNPIHVLGNSPFYTLFLSSYLSESDAASHFNRPVYTVRSKGKSQQRKSRSRPKERKKSHNNFWPEPFCLFIVEYSSLLSLSPHRVTFHTRKAFTAKVVDTVNPPFHSWLFYGCTDGIARWEKETKICRVNKLSVLRRRRLLRAVANAHTHTFPKRKKKIGKTRYTVLRAAQLLNIVLSFIG